MTQPQTRNAPKGQRARLGMLAAGALTALGLVLATPSDAQAAPRVLRPGTRPWVADIGFGPSIIVATPTDFRWRGRRGVQFKFMQEIGGHFQGDAEGPALGATFEEAFLRDTFRFSAGAKFWWDIKIIDDLGLYLTPEGKLGMALWTNPVQGFFNTQVGFAGKLMLDDRWMVFLRPITADFFIGRTFIFAWDIMVGGGVTW